MRDIRLAKLPDRTPVKISVTLTPDSNRMLQAYAELYRECYGEAEPVPTPIPAMLASFRKSDIPFAKAWEEKEREGSASNMGSRSPAARGRYREPTEAPGRSTSKAGIAVISTFIPAKDAGWIGRIRILAINVKVRFVPNDNRENDNAPLFRVFVGHSRICDA